MREPRHHSKLVYIAGTNKFYVVVKKEKEIPPWTPHYIEQGVWPLRYDGPTDLRYGLGLPLRITTTSYHRSTTSSDIFGARASVASLELGVDFGAWCVDFCPHSWLV